MAWRKCLSNKILLFYIIKMNMWTLGLTNEASKDIVMNFWETENHTIFLHLLNRTLNRFILIIVSCCPAFHLSCSHFKQSHLRCLSRNSAGRELQTQRKPSVRREGEEGKTLNRTTERKFTFCIWPILVLVTLCTAPGEMC